MKIFTALVLAFVIYGLWGTSLYASRVTEISSVRVNEETYFIFTPTSTGYWTFATSANFDSDPMLWIYNIYGHLIASDDDSGGNLNARITLHMVEGADYIIVAGFFGGGSGSYTLDVFAADSFELPLTESFQPETEVISGDGGTIQAHWNTIVSFTPNTTGLWLIEVTAENDAEAALIIEDSLGNFIAWNEYWFAPSEGWLIVHLVASTEYFISVVTEWDALMYTLSVSQTNDFEPWFSAWEELIESIPEETESFPDNGEIHVTDEIWYSFVPNATGVWTFITSEQTGGGPFLLLTDKYGSFFVTDDGVGDLSAVMSIYLAEGEEYLIWARFRSVATSGSYVLSAFQGLPPEQLEETTSVVAPIIIPSNGGIIQVEDSGLSFETFTFTPNTTGSWTIQSSVWVHTLAITDPNYSFHIFRESRSWNQSETLITIDLAANVEYIILAEVDTRGEGVLTVSPSTQLTYTIDGTILRNVVRETYFSFTPDTTGTWIFSTSQNGNSDPYLWIMDSNGNIIASDDDSGGSLNAFIKIELTAGETYTLRAGFFGESEGQYLLTIRKGGEQTPEFPRLPSPNR